jgi:hypothetical protein
VDARPHDDRGSVDVDAIEEVAMATTTLDDGARLARAAVGQLGGRFSVEFGIDIDADDAEIDRWFLAATLVGTRISTTIAERAFRCSRRRGSPAPRSLHQLTNRDARRRYDPLCVDLDDELR